MRNGLMWMSLLGVFLAAFLLVQSVPPLGSSLGAADVFLELKRFQGEKVALSLVRLSAESLTADEARTVRSVLEADLRRSLFFRIVRPPVFSELSSTDVPSGDLVKKIAAEGIESAVWLKTYRQGPDVVVEARVFDGATGQLVLGKRYIGDLGILRTIIHRLSDEIVYRYTGERGIAQTRIVYTSNLTGHKELYLMDYDGFNPRRLTSDRSINISARWSPDGKWVTYTSYIDSNPNIYTLDIETGKRWRVVGFSGLNISPAWSPDGRKLAFSSSRDGPAQLYLASKEGSGITKLTPDTSDSLSPSWSPTGKEMTFNSNRGGTPQIYVMTAEGTNVRRLTFIGEYNTSPSWSPKGDWVAYTCQVDMRLRICMVRPDGSKTLQLTDGTWDDEAPAWSPDGKYLVFRSNRSGNGDLYAITLDGTGIERLTFNGMQNSGPAWSPSL